MEHRIKILSILVFMFTCIKAEYFLLEEAPTSPTRLEKKVTLFQNYITSPETSSAVHQPDFYRIRLYTILLIQRNIDACIIQKLNELFPGQSFTRADLNQYISNYHTPRFTSKDVLAFDAGEIKQDLESVVEQSLIPFLNDLVSCDVIASAISLEMKTKPDGAQVVEIVPFSPKTLTQFNAYLETVDLFAGYLFGSLPEENRQEMLQTVISTVKENKDLSDKSRKFLFSVVQQYITSSKEIESSALYRLQNNLIYLKQHAS